MDPLAGPALLPLGPPASLGPGLVPLGPPPPLPPDLAAQPAGFVVPTDDGIRIHFLDWDGGAEAAAVPPPGRPGVLLVHGLATTAETWAPVARRLRPLARVVAVDLRGHGLSDAPTAGYDRDTLAADAVAVLEGTGFLARRGSAPAGPLVLAGLGYGACVAAWTAHALGDACAGLVLVDGGWEDLAAATGAAPEEWLAAIEEPPAVLASMDAWLADRADFDPASWDPDQQRAARAQVVETAAGRLKLAIHPHALAASVAALWSYDPAAVLSDVAARVVALLARDDAAGTRAAALRSIAALRLAAGRAAIGTAMFPARGHNLVRYEPDAVAAAILAVAG